MNNMGKDLNEDIKFPVVWQPTLGFPEFTYKEELCCISREVGNQSSNLVCIRKWSALM